MRIFLLAVSMMVIAGAAQAADQTAQGNPQGAARLEVVPALPRPVPEPLTGVKPVVTVGGSEDYLPDPNKARQDAVSPRSREHLETMIRDLKQR